MRTSIPSAAGMDSVATLAANVERFVREVVVPYETDPRCGGAHGPTQDLVEELRDKARTAGLLAPQRQN